MSWYKRFSPNFFSGMWFIVMIAVWIAFAPVQMGGLASYIIVIGNSMEPNFHIGDLVVVHDEAFYQVGDAVVYRNPEFGSFIFHRIIEQEMNRFILKGDNNSWADAFQPSQDEVLGKLWLHVPKGGNLVKKIRKPINMAGIGGILGGILAVQYLAGNSNGRKRMDKERFASVKDKVGNWFRKSGGSMPQKSSSNQGISLEGSFFALGLVAFASMILGIISFSRPATRSAQDDISYSQLGLFVYTASAPQGVYDANTIQNGDPIFPRLVCSVDMTYNYTLVAQQAQDITGTYRLTATIAEETSGWQRTVALQDEESFTGNTFGTNAKLDLCKMENLTQSMEQATEFRPGIYTLTISPNVKVDGEIAGRTLQTTFNRGPQFNYGRVHFYLMNDDEQGNPLTFTEPGSLSETRSEANSMQILGLVFPIPALRLVAIIGLIVSLGGLLLLGTKLQKLSTSDPVQFIRARYSSLLIDIQNADMIDPSTQVDVASIDDLGRLAERFNAMILHAEFQRSHTYYVQDEGTTYRFVMDLQETGSAVPADEAESQVGGL